MAVSIKVKVPKTVTASGSSAPVLILDQYGATLATLTGGSTYSVYVYDGVIDNGPPYTNTIINP